MDERELVQKILAGDAEAKGLFFTTHRERVYRNCVHLLGYQDPEAEDVAQEVFLTAFEKLPGFEFRSTLATWLTQICIYKCHNRFRQRAKLVQQEEAGLEELLRPAALARDDREGGLEKWRVVEKCLAQMGKDCREIIELRELKTLSYVEVGKALKIPLGTVMSRLSRCKRALKTLALQFLKDG
ncbi:MAG TPA: RNA polymerase sigma factor [bacterium]|nr:RNA polymerase sigma factor [bacterium]